MSRPIQPGNFVRITLEDNSSLFEIKSVSSQEILVFPPNQPNQLSRLIPTENRWVVQGAEHLSYEFEFSMITPEVSLQQPVSQGFDLIADDKLITEMTLSKLEPKDVISACQMNDHLQDLCESEIIPNFLARDIPRKQKIIQKLRDLGFSYIRIYEIAKEIIRPREYKLMLQLAKEGQGEILIPILLLVKNFRTFNVQEIANQAYFYDHEDILKFFRKRHITPTSGAYLEKIARGNVEDISKAIAKAKSYVNLIFNSIIEGGYLEELKDYYMRMGYFKLITDASYHEAAKNGHLDILKWLIEIETTYFYPGRVLKSSLTGSHLNVIKWLLENYELELPQDAAEIVLEGTFNIYLYPFQQGTPERQIPVLNYLEQHGILPPNYGMVVREIPERELDENPDLFDTNDIFEYYAPVLEWLQKRDLFIPSVQFANIINERKKRIETWEDMDVDDEDYSRYLVILEWLAQQGITPTN